MSTYLAAGLEALPDDSVVTVEKNRWRRIWAICVGLWTVIAIAAGIVAIAMSAQIDCSRLTRSGCTDARLDDAFPWLMAMAGAVVAALLWFAVWWACREYRLVLRLDSAD